MATARERLQNKLKSAFADTQKLGSFLLDLDYYEAANPSYNPTTGAITESTTKHSVKGLFYDFKDLEIDNEIVKPTDRKVLIPVRVGSTDQITFVLRPDDWIESGGVKEEVVSVMTEPSDSIQIIHVRRAG